MNFDDHKVLLTRLVYTNTHLHPSTSFSTLHQADALQVQLTETMHARTRLITELKEVVAPLCKREQELYNRNTVLAINISLADVQQQSPCVYPPFLGDELPDETRQYVKSLLYMLVVLVM